MRMAISTQSGSIGDNPANFSVGTVLLRFILDLVKEQRHQSEIIHLDEPQDDHFFVTNSSTTSSADGDLVDLLMPIWAYQSAAVYLIFISVFGLLMNIVVIIVIINDPQKSPLNWMLLNLACSDGMIAGFGTPISAAAAFQYHWPFGDELCVAYAMIMSTTGIGSITTLTALALWRCQLVVYCPAKRSGAFANHHSSGGSGGSSGKLGRVQATILLTLIWTYSLAVTCPPLFGWGRYDREAAHISCSVNWESKMDNNRSYILYMFSFGLFVPLVVIVASYVSILRVVKKTGKFKRTMMVTLQPTPQHQISDHHHPPTEKKSEPKKQNDAAEKRVTVMVACMVGAFLAAWTPYSILALFETFIGYAGQHQQTRNISSSFTSGIGGHRQMDDEKSDDAEENFFYYVGTISPAFATIPSLFAKTSAVLNPLIYGLLNTQFRMACDKFVTRLLGRRRHQHNHHHHKNKHLRQFLNCPSGSPTLKPSASIRLSMKDIVSNESQSAYVMCRPQQFAISPSLTRYLLQQQPNEQFKSFCPVAEPETSFTYQQQSGPAVRMKSSIKDSSIDSDRQDEDEEAMKLVAVRLISDSVTNDNEESTFFRQTSFIEDTVNDNQLIHHPDDTIPSHPPIILPPMNPAQSKLNDPSADIDAGGDEDQGNEDNVIEADNIIRISFITASVDC